MSDAAAQEYIDEVATITNETYYTFAAFALLAFEWVITLDREVRLVWGRNLTGASVLFVMNRYWLFFQYITQVITAYPMSQYGCSIVGYMVIVGNGGPSYIWAAFSVLRAYALSSRRWWVIPLVFTFYIPDIVLTAIYFNHLKPLALPSPFNCVLSNSLADEEWIHAILTFATVTIASRVSLIFGDLVVLVITWYSTFGIKKAAAGARVRTSLTDALLKDGTLYFVCLLILNVVNIVVNIVPKSSAVSAFQDPITSILVSRFLLNLRDTLSRGPDATLTTLTLGPGAESRVRGPGVGATSTLDFAAFVDPMGAELDHGTGTEWEPASISDSRELRTLGDGDLASAEKGMGRRESEVDLESPSSEEEISDSVESRV